MQNLITVVILYDKGTTALGSRKRIIGSTLTKIIVTLPGLASCSGGKVEFVYADIIIVIIAPGTILEYLKFEFFKSMC